ncbi:hypothetical protein E2C01_048243 [Portunus trituberculatus]|uniref:Uncharacterized protein n=1 Tax=Portunus trituberculatus TaxID=210409 RepID=A0A5B7GAM3_PORTR|nr:hypothetical protein [Portunus trituberculatus]
MTDWGGGKAGACAVLPARECTKCSVVSQSWESASPAHSRRDVKVMRWCVASRRLCAVYLVYLCCIVASVLCVVVCSSAFVSRARVFREW